MSRQVVRTNAPSDVSYQPLPVSPSDADKGTSLWSLILFTFFAQAAVGTVFFQAVLYLFETIVSSVVVGAALLFLAIGFVGAFFHLQRPAGAMFAMSNLQTSWLSREMLTGIVFGLSVVFSMATVFLGGKEYLVLGSALISLAIGMLFITCIISLYRLRTVPAWNSGATPLAFLFTAGLTGGVTVAGLQLLPHGNSAQSLWWIGPTVLGMAGGQVITLWIHMARLHKSTGAARKSADVIISKHRFMLVLRIAVTLVGATLFFVATENTAPEMPLVLLSIALIFTGEFLGRILFFAMFKREGLTW